MRRAISLAAAAAVVLTALAAVQLGLVAHPGLHPPSPPAYDYDTATPGTQPPTAPELFNPRGRFLQTQRLAFPVIVPVAEVQALLPPGFTANPLPPPNPPGQANLSLLFDFQGRCELLAEGIASEPASGLLVTHVVRNTALNRDELLILAAEFSAASFVDCVNDMWGPGSAHLADVEAKIEERRGRLQLSFDVADQSIGLNIRAQATSSGPIVARGAHADPALPQRSLDGRMFANPVANPAHRFAIMTDGLAVPTTSANLRLTLGGREIAAADDDIDGDARKKKRARSRLGLPGGRITVLGVGGPNVNFARWVELIYQPE